MSFGLQMKFEDGGSLALLDRRLRKLANPDLHELLENIGSEVESQTRYRISSEKKAPDGSEWEDWSENYAKGKHGRTKTHEPHPGSLRSSGGHTMLELDGGLLDSIQFEVQADATVIGSNLVYAGAINASRQYLGLSRENTEDILDLTKLFLEARLR